MLGPAESWGVQDAGLSLTRQHSVQLVEIGSKLGQVSVRPESKNMPPARILVADDDPFLRELLTHKLSSSGYVVLVAVDGGDALAQCRDRKPDLAVLDAMMPIVDGFEVLRRLKADPATAELPIIMLTALRRDEDVVGALKLGADDYLIKPFIPDELIARIGRLLPRGTNDAGTLGNSGSRQSNLG